MAEASIQAKDFGFGPKSLEERQNDWREILAFIPVRPKQKDEDIRAVAQALKTNGADFEPVFLEFAKKYGIRSHRAKWIWSKEKAESDAFEELLEQYNAAKNQRPRFSPLSAAMLEAMPAPNSRIKGVLPIVGLAALYGASASGKSFLGLDMAAAIAEGLPFFGHSTKPAPVGYVVLEGEGGIRGRVIAWQRHHGRAMPDNVRFLPQPFRITDPQDVTDLAAVCPSGSVVFIDTLNRAAPGMDENSSKDMGAMIEGAKALQRLIGGLVVLVAHTGKDSAKGLRGHSSLFAALDAAILVSREGDARSWKVDKAKDGRDGDTHYFRLHVVEIDTDEDGDAVTSCVVMPEESSGASTRSTFKPVELSEGKALMMQTFEECAAENRSVEHFGIAIVDQTNLKKKFYEKYIRINHSASPDTLRTIFNRNLKALDSEGFLKFDRDSMQVKRGSKQHAVIDIEAIGRNLPDSVKKLVSRNTETAAEQCRNSTDRNTETHPLL